MASLGHIAIGCAAGRLHGRRGRSAVRAALVFSVLSLLPDLDVVAFAVGIPYAHPFGHRGASHALLVGLVLGIGAALLPASDRAQRTRAVMLGAAVAASHGLLDALTDGGLGVALLWPFSDARLFFPWQPIPVAPIGAGMLSTRGAIVVLTELLYFLPLLLYALWPRRTQPAAGD